MWWLATAMASPGLLDADLASDDERDSLVPRTPFNDDDLNAVVGGIVDDIDDYPSTVFLQVCDLGNNCGGCTGTLIHPEWILTAGHCLVLSDEPLAFVDVNFGVGGPYGFLGDRAGISYVVHPEYVPSAATSTPDIALVQLELAVNSIESVALNDEALTTGWLGIELDLVGYGRTSDEDGNSAGVRRWADVAIFAYDGLHVRTADEFQNGCFGDSGGPMYRNTPEGLELVGVNSFVSGGCVDGTTGAVRVDRHLDFITTHVPDVRLSAAEPPVVVDKPEVLRDLTEPIGPDTSRPQVATPEWNDPQRPTAGMYRNLPFNCAHGPATGLSGLALLVGLGLRRRR